jgi:Fur family ferric uptake transcriptional regulator
MRRDAPLTGERSIERATGPDAEELLRARGCRATKPRVAVLQAVLDAGRPLDAAELTELAGRSIPGIHEATVYRNITLLSDLGLVTHVHAGHGPSLVKLADDDAILVVCRVCGTTERLPAPAIDAFRGDVDRALGFRLEIGHFALEGICARCRDDATTCD